MTEVVNTPDEGELVVVTVKNVKQNGVYVDFDEYPGIEGFIFIGEIASGWVKNIRTFVRDGQRLICKVMRTKKTARHLNYRSSQFLRNAEEIDYKSGKMSRGLFSY